MSTTETHGRDAGVGGFSPVPSVEGGCGTFREIGPDVYTFSGSSPRSMPLSGPSSGGVFLISLGIRIFSVSYNSLVLFREGP